MKLAFIIVLLLVALIPSQTLCQNAVNQDEETLRRMYSDWEVRVEVDQSVSIIGEWIYIRVIFTSDEPRVVPWSNVIEINNNLYIHENSEEGLELTTTRVRGPEIANNETPTQRKEFVLELSTLFESRGSRQEYGFSCIKPGHYIGRFIHGIKSPPFTFDVIGVPLEKEYLWKIYRNIYSMDADRRRLSLTKRQIADSINTLVDVFLTEPVGQTWRLSALNSSMWIFGVCRDAWQQRDSTKCTTIIREMLHEPKCDTNSVLSVIQASFCHGMKGLAAADALDRTVQALNIPDLVEPAQVYSDKLRALYNRHHRGDK